MVDLHDAVQTLQTLRPVIVPDDDFMVVEALQQQIGNTQATRTKEVENINDKLKGLLRALEAAKISCSRPTSVPSARGHEKMINELDSSRRSHLKAIDSAEGILTAKESELGALKEKLKKLETKDVAKEVLEGLDSSALRLEIWRAMGFEPIVDSTGRLVKMIVRTRSGDVHCVEGKEDGQEVWKLAIS
ncbi:hypothetical protein BJ322DRAFT_1016150 [Thelephora terrestris]|uniref:Kinetochore protein Spc24 n=1 Tax=Thelephora terrestris TaxID=56493 RepID=A0A9P6HPL3_9AGAM|nr:hypothetical protein BJ322DRAFT_1016150 [Thelephora terrestris]